MSDEPSGVSPMRVDYKVLLPGQLFGGQKAVQR